MITTLLEHSSTLYDHVTSLQQQSSITDSQLQSVLRSIFGISEFRPNQLSIIHSVLRHENWVCFDCCYDSSYSSLLQEAENR